MNDAKKLILDFFAAAAADAIAMDDFVAAGFIQHGPSLPDDNTSAFPEFIRRGHEQTVSGEGKAEMLEPVFVVAENDLVTTCYYLPQPDPRNPGSFYDYYSFDTYRVRDGRIVEHWPSFTRIAPALLIPDSGVARSAATTLSPEPSDAAANKQLVLEFYRRVFDAHDPDAVTEFLAEDYRQHAGHVLPGRDGVANFVREVFPDGPIPAPDEVSVPPSVLVAEADLVVIAGLLPQPEPGRAGETYPYYVYDAYRVRDGMLVEHWSGLNIAAPPVHTPPPDA